MDNPTISGFTSGMTENIVGKTCIQLAGCTFTLHGRSLIRDGIRETRDETGSASRDRPAGFLHLCVPGALFAGYPAGDACIRAPCGICRFNAAGPAGAADKLTAPGVLPQQNGAQSDRDPLYGNSTSLDAAGGTVENRALCVVRSRSRVPAPPRGGFTDKKRVTGIRGLCKNPPLRQPCPPQRGRGRMRAGITCTHKYPRTKICEQVIQHHRNRGMPQRRGRRFTGAPKSVLWFSLRSPREQKSSF